MRAVDRRFRPTLKRSRSVPGKRAAGRATTRRRRWRTIFSVSSTASRCAGAADWPLTQRLYRQARWRKPLVALGSALLLSLVGLIWYSVRTGWRRLSAKKTQSRHWLAQRLRNKGISKMGGFCAVRDQLPPTTWNAEKPSSAKADAAASDGFRGTAWLRTGSCALCARAWSLGAARYPQALNPNCSKPRPGRQRQR